MKIAFKPTHQEIYNTKLQFAVFYLCTISGIIGGIYLYLSFGIENLKFDENSTINYFWPQNIYIFDEKLRLCFPLEKIYFFMLMNALVAVFSIAAIVFILICELCGSTGIGSIPGLNKLCFAMIVLILFVSFNKFDSEFSRFDFSCQVSMGTNIYKSILMVHIFYLCCAFLIANILQKKVVHKGESKNGQ